MKRDDDIERERTRDKKREIKRVIEITIIVVSSVNEKSIYARLTINVASHKTRHS